MPLFFIAPLRSVSPDHKMRLTGCACPACWIRVVVVRAVSAVRAPAEQRKAVACSTEVAAEPPARCAVAGAVRSEAAFCSYLSDRRDCSAPAVLARVDSVAEHCSAPHSDDRSALAVRKNDSRPCSLPADCLKTAGSEQVDSSQADCCRDDCCQDDFPDGCCRHDCFHRDCCPGGCSAVQPPDVRCAPVARNRDWIRASRDDYLGSVDSERAAPNDCSEQALAGHCVQVAQSDDCRADCSSAHFPAAVVPGVQDCSKASRRYGCPADMWLAEARLAWSNSRPARAARRIHRFAREEPSLPVPAARWVAPDAAQASVRARQKSAVAEEEVSSQRQADLRLLPAGLPRGQNIACVDPVPPQEPVAQLLLP